MCQWPRSVCGQCWQKPHCRAINADVAQLVEHFTRNEGVRGSSPRVGFTQRPYSRRPDCRRRRAYWRMVTARATTNPIVTRETSDCALMMLFAVGVSGIVSVGLNAVAFVSDT